MATFQNILHTYTLLKVEVMESFMIKKNMKKCEDLFFFLFLRWLYFNSNNPTR